MGHDAYSVTSNYSPRIPTATFTEHRHFRDAHRRRRGGPLERHYQHPDHQPVRDVSTSLATGWNNRQSYLVAGTVLTLFGYVPSQSNPWQKTISWSQNTPGLAGYINEQRLVALADGRLPPDGHHTVNGTQTTNYPAVANSYR